MTDNINIRRCTYEDEDVYIKLNLEFMAYEIGDNPSWDEVRSITGEDLRQIFREAMEQPQLITLVVMEREGDIIGFANLLTVYSIWSLGKSLIIDDLYVRESCRGTGAGSSMMTYAYDMAVREGYKRVQFLSEKTNPKAKLFYEKMGYKPLDMYMYLRYTKE